MIREVEVERIVYQDVVKHVDRHIEVPVEVVKYVDVEKIIEKPYEVVRV